MLGYGLAGSVFHAPLIAATDGLRLASIVTANPERAEQARREHPNARVLGRAEDLWAAAGEHDLVVVATPNKTHVPLAEAAVGARLGVVVDKPLAPSAAQGRRLVELAAAAGVRLAVFHNRRWDGDFLTLRRLVGEGALGALHRFESRFERWRPEPKPGAWRELAAPEEAGGVLFDLGSHLIDQALVLLGPVASVYAEVETRRPGAQVDDDVFVALAHRSGARSHLWASQVAAQPGPRLRALGSAATYEKWGLDPQEDALRRGEPPAEEAPGQLGAGDDVRSVATEPGDYPAFYAALAGGEVPVTGAEGVAVLELIEAALASARERRVVELP